MPTELPSNNYMSHSLPCYDLNWPTRKLSQFLQRMVVLLSNNLFYLHPGTLINKTTTFKLIYGRGGRQTSEVIKINRFIYLETIRKYNFALTFLLYLPSDTLIINRKQLNSLIHRYVRITNEYF